MKIKGIFQGSRITRVAKRHSRRGQTLVEYALILVMVSIVAISVLVVLGNQTKSLYSRINSQISQAAAS